MTRLLLALLLSTPAHARDLLLTIRTTPASIVECTALGLQYGYASPILAPACSDHRDPQHCTIILPSGPAVVLPLLVAYGPQDVLEHELAHCLGRTHSVLFPWGE